MHLTLTSEKKPYRWRPLTSPPASAGLTDPMGYFWPDVPNARRAIPKAVEAELRAQIDATLRGRHRRHASRRAYGDRHVPEFVDIYVKLGLEYKLPILLVRDYNTFNPRSYSGPMSNDNYNAALTRAIAKGFPIFDLVQETIWDRKDDAETAYGRDVRTVARRADLSVAALQRAGRFRSDRAVPRSHTHRRIRPVQDRQDQGLGLRARY